MHSKKIYSSCLLQNWATLTIGVPWGISNGRRLFVFGVSGVPCGKWRRIAPGLVCTVCVCKGNASFLIPFLQSIYTTILNVIKFLGGQVPKLLPLCSKRLPDPLAGYILLIHPSKPFQGPKRWPCMATRYILKDFCTGCVCKDMLAFRISVLKYTPQLNVSFLAGRSPKSCRSAAQGYLAPCRLHFSSMPMQGLQYFETLLPFTLKVLVCTVCVCEQMLAFSYPAPKLLN